MKKLFLYFGMILTMMLLSLAVMAQVVPEGDPAKSLLDLIVNHGQMAPLSIGMSIVICAIQLLKSKYFNNFFEAFKYKRALITILGQIYAICYLVASGTSLLNAVITGLFVSGGAVAIWEALKPFFGKKAKVKI